MALPGKGLAMKIDPNFLDATNAASQNVGNTPARPSSLSPDPSKSSELGSSTFEGGDTVQLSGTLSEVQQLKAQLSQVPDVRANRVAALQQQIQQGTYRPSSGAIADAMMANLLGTDSTK